MASDSAALDTERASLCDNCDWVVAEGHTVRWWATGRLGLLATGKVAVFFGGLVSGGCVDKETEVESG